MSSVNKIILGSIVILFFIIILIIIITNALRFKPVQQINQTSFPTVAPRTVLPLNNNSRTSPQLPSQNKKSSSLQNSDSSNTGNTTSTGINNTSPKTASSNSANQQNQSSSYISLYQQTESILYTPSNSKLISSKDKDNMTYINNFIPYDTDDFSIEYSSILNKYIVTTKSPKGPDVFTDWAKENGILTVFQNPNLAIVSDKTPVEIQSQLPQELQPTTDPNEHSKQSQKQISLLLNLFNTFFSIPDIASSSYDFQLPSPTPTVSLFPSMPLSSSSPSPSSALNPQPSYSPQSPGSGYVYYPQCGGEYDNYPLTSTVTICKCGCGPTTVSMILSSYLKRAITPPEVVDIYKSQGRAQCGTSLGSAKKILGEQGVTTSDYIVPYNENGYTIERVADDMKSYIRNGWTIFVLAGFASSADLNHFFWITQIDDQNNVYAYDPYYGSGKIPPINQNSRYPYPKYLAAFGVRK